MCIRNIYGIIDNNNNIYNNIYGLIEKNIFLKHSRLKIIF